MTPVSSGRSLFDLESYAQRALHLCVRFVSVTQAWVKTVGALSGPALIVTGTAGAAALLMLVCMLSLRNRVRRERRRFRKEIADQIARAEAAESANAAKADFLASMGYQIRTPLNAIIGFTELALKTDLNPQLRESLDTVRTSADWLMYTVNDVLDLSRIEAGTIELDNVPFSIGECIQSAMKIVEREAAAKKLTTACRIDPALPQVLCGDPMRLRHALFNLLNNAVRSTTRGSVVLSATLESDGADDVLVRVEVTDTGIGIPPAKQPLIFEPFRQVNESGPIKSRASALGLPISRRLIELMGGTITLQSQLGAGSRFEFTARFQKQKVAEVEASTQAVEGSRLQEVSILVAEDDAVNRRLITKILESAGHRVGTATNGEEALHSVKTEAFDLIFMDLEMPDLDGLEATRAIRKDEAPGLRVPIYALTAHATPSDRERCLAAGMDGFLTKPLAVDDVLQLVSKLARQPGGAGSTLVERTGRRGPEGAASGALAQPDDHLEARSAASPSGADLTLDPAQEAPDNSCADLENMAGALGNSTCADSSEREFDLQAIWKNPDGVASDTAETTDHSRRSQKDPIPVSVITDDGEAGKLDPGVFSVHSEENGRPRAWDPFEQARKALSNSRFDVRVIHNNGDPSDRNLI